MQLLEEVNGGDLHADARSIRCNSGEHQMLSLISLLSVPADQFASAAKWGGPHLLQLGI
jgi:hypothetical protein